MNTSDPESSLASENRKLLKLPTEFLAAVASYLVCPQDLNSFAVVCKMTMSACIYQLRLPQLTNTDPRSKNTCGYILEHYVERKSRVGEITLQTFMMSGSFVA
jgi:hypothetical protein